MLHRCFCWNDLRHPHQSFNEKWRASDQIQDYSRSIPCVFIKSSRRNLPCSSKHPSSRRLRWSRCETSCLHCRVMAVGMQILWRVFDSSTESCMLSITTCELMHCQYIQLLGFLPQVNMFVKNFPILYPSCPKKPRTFNRRLETILACSGVRVLRAALISYSFID